MDIKETLNQVLKREIGETIIDYEQLGGGVNSIIYKIVSDYNIAYIAKKYIARKGDHRDRLSTEYLGLSFLWENGIRNIPRPICMDKSHNIGIYSFIKGRKMNSWEVSVNNIHEAAHFVNGMHSLVKAKDADKQPVASEACYSISAYIGCVETRLGNLRGRYIKNNVFSEMHRYLEDDFSPFFMETKQFIKDRARCLNIDINSEIQKKNKTLSPSDFGFHNIILGEEGALFFIDFEYYGWDDPAKLIGDFFLQPAVPVPSAYREIFFEDVYEFLGRDDSLLKRLPLIYNLLALKWCLIMLNIFLRESGEEGDEKAFAEQLEKSRNKLSEIRHELNENAFPFSLN